MARENVLVVDDERDILELVKYNLDKEGYRVTVVASGEDALAATRAKMPDLIVLDLMLPGVDGLEVCRRLKSDAKTRGIPIVMLTATEFRILLYLAKRPGWVFTRQQIVDAAQGDDSFINDRYVTDRSVDVHIVSLRRKLGCCGAYIETVRGVGYRLQDQ